MAGRKAKPLASEQLFDYAVRALGGRAHSTGELREKLRRRAATAGDVEPTLQRLKEAGYVNDAQFADSFAASRKENEGFGKMRVLRDLRQRRIAPALADKAVQKAFAESDETVMIEAFLERRCRGKDLSNEKNLASVYRRLRYAGFSAGNSIRVLKKHAKDAEILDTLEEE